ncbi:hypothetical protein ACN47E_004097 [Coniothyrium glycines]
MPHSEHSKGTTKSSARKALEKRGTEKLQEAVLNKQQQEIVFVQQKSADPPLEDFLKAIVKNNIGKRNSRFKKF